MPLLKFDLMEGRDQQAIQKLLDASHRAVVKALGVPERDRYQIVYQHPAHEFVVQDTGLGFKRSDNVVVSASRADIGRLSKRRSCIRLWPMNSRVIAELIRKTL